MTIAGTGAPLSSVIDMRIAQNLSVIKRSVVPS
jgi:hypothetical protein